MRKVMVRYKVKADAAASNREYIERVFAELAAEQPGGLRYASFIEPDGVSFMHIAFVEGDANPLGASAAFKAFQAGIRDRCEVPPQAIDLDQVGDYRVFTD